MLVLTRKLGEVIRIGDNIKIKVIEIDNKYIKLGIDAPRNIAVNREEVYTKIQEENIVASTASNADTLKEMIDLLKQKQQSNKE